MVASAVLQLRSLWDRSGNYTGARSLLTDRASGPARVRPASPLLAVRNSIVETVSGAAQLQPCKVAAVPGTSQPSGLNTTRSARCQKSLAADQ
jgi:hypothetical protein